MVRSSFVHIIAVSVNVQVKYSFFKNQNSIKEINQILICFPPKLGRLAHRRNAVSLRYLKNSVAASPLVLASSPALRGEVCIDLRMMVGFLPP